MIGLYPPYDLVLADPPWDFTRWSEKAQRHVTKEYPVMSVDAICGVPVRPLLAADAVLCLWATFPNLLAALKVIDAWGFVYKTQAFTWVKVASDGRPRFGLGYYTRANAEVCLLATKGKPLPRKDHGVRSLILAQRREHSRKPDEQYEGLERLFGDVRRVELFARYSRPGWDAWGQEVK